MQVACLVKFVVRGTPAPQGSKSFKGFTKKGRAILVESSKAVKPWRVDVAYAAAEAGRVLGPVGVKLFFTLPKPKSAPKKRKTYPDRRPDLDKLVRSTLDALVQAGTIEDDSRVVLLSAEKAFPLETSKALDVPGCVVIVESLES